MSLSSTSPLNSKPTFSIVILVPKSSFTFFVAYLPRLVCTAGIESTNTKMMKSSSKIATIFDVIFNTFLICVKVITFLRINYISLANVYLKLMSNGNYVNWNYECIKKRK